MKIRIRLFAVASLIFFCGLCHAKDPVVAVMLSSDMEFYKEVASGFKIYFADRGSAIKISEYNLKTQDPNTMPQLLSQKPDLILAVGEDALKTAKEQAKGIPVVFAMVFNTKGMVDENTTGIYLDLSPDLKISGIKKVLPGVKTIGMLYSPNSAETYESVKAECEKRGIELKAKIVNSDAEFTDSFNSVFRGVDCFLIILDPKLYFSQTLKYILLESLKQKIPVIGLSSFYTKAGALASFDCDFKDLGHQAGDMASKILGGEQASAIKLVHPRKYTYSVNLITAGRIGINVPSNIVKEATEVYDQ